MGERFAGDKWLIDVYELYMFFNKYTYPVIPHRKFIRRNSEYFKRASNPSAGRNVSQLLVNSADNL